MYFLEWLDVAKPIHVQSKKNASERIELDVQMRRFPAIAGYSDLGGIAMASGR